MLAVLKTAYGSSASHSCQPCPFLAKEKEQAEVGQSPTLLAICAANGVLRILRGYATVFLLVKEKKTGYQAVFLIDKFRHLGLPGLLPSNKANIWKISM